MFGRNAITSRSHHGFTLTELTAVLAVMVTFGLVFASSVGTIVTDSRSARARSDCQIIVSAIVQFSRDNGFFPSWTLAHEGGPGLPENRVQLLIGPGHTPREDQPSLWTTGMAGRLSEQLMNNVPGYRLRTPTSQNGWNGPYLPSDISADPWGNRYIVNIQLIDTSASATTRGGGVRAAVWILSAGANGIIETPFGQSSVNAALRGDDIGVRLQ